MNRRDFFVRAFGAVLAARLAPLLPETPSFWMSEPKTYVGAITLADIDRVCVTKILPAITEQFFRTDPLLVYLKERR